MSPKKVTDGLFNLFLQKSDHFWENENLVSFPITEKDGITENIHHFMVTMDTNQKCFYLKADELQKRKDSLDILPVQSLPIPKFA